jgi:D-amino-acid dehydrogenase
MQSIRRRTETILSTMRVTVVGAGIVGLATAYHLARSGVQVSIIDRDPEGDKASLGNAGAIAVTEVVPASVPGAAWRVLGWMLDPLGPLAVRPAHAPRLIPWLARFAKVAAPREVERISQALAAINSRVYEDLLPMLSDAGILSELHRTGALTVYETEAGYRRDTAEWACKRSRGIEVQELTGAQAREMEPALGPCVVRAVFTPQWSHVSDPKTLVQGVRQWLVRHGIVIRTGEVLNVVTDTTASSISLVLSDGSFIPTDKVVIAAGAWSAILARRLGDRALLESERGYNMTLPAPNIELGRQLIFAERKFVATPLSCGLRIGGAAEFAGLDAPPNFERSSKLLELAARYLPGLRAQGGTCWAGHRPATPDSLPVIGHSKHRPNVFYAFGHGHLGLTQAATTGRLIGELVRGETPCLDVRPYAIDRFA